MVRIFTKKRIRDRIGFVSAGLYRGIEVIQSAMSSWGIGDFCWSMSLMKSDLMLASMLDSMLASMLVWGSIPARVSIVGAASVYRLSSMLVLGSRMKLLLWVSVVVGRCIRGLSTESLWWV